MSQPVTTNPIIIMLINMTVVFIVLLSLSFIIKLIHMIDPTKEPEEDETAMPTSIPVNAEPPPTDPEPMPVVEKGISGEVIAVIAAVVAGYGYSMSQVRAVRIARNKNSAWKTGGFDNGVTRR